MPRVPTRQRAGVPVDVKPIGALGLNTQTDPAMLRAGQMRQARNVDASALVYARRRGGAKVSFLTDQAASHGAKVFADVGKYATFSPPAIGKGGFGVKFHFTAVRAGTGWMIDSAQDVGFAHYVFRASLNSTGLFQVFVMWSDGTASSITTPAITANAEVDALVIFNAIAGTLTLYVNGDVAGTPVTGLAAGRLPWQGTSVPWYFGVSNNPTVGIVAGSAFAGALDAFTLFTFAGVDLTDADASATPPRISLLEELRRRSWQDWPCPEGTMVLAHYGFDEAAGTVMYDSSERQDHGLYTGAYANAARVAIRAQNGNFLGTTRRASVGVLEDGRVNIAVAGGQHYSETLMVGS